MRARTKRPRVGCSRFLGMAQRPEATLSHGLVRRAIDLRRCPWVRPIVADYADRFAYAVVPVRRKSGGYRRVARHDCPRSGRAARSRARRRRARRPARSPGGTCPGAAGRGGPRRPFERGHRHRPAGRGIWRAALHRSEGGHGHPAGAARPRRARGAGRARLLGGRRRSRLGRDSDCHDARRGLQRGRSDVAVTARRGLASCRLAGAGRECRPSGGRVGRDAAGHGVHSGTRRVAQTALPPWRHDRRGVRRLD